MAWTTPITAVSNAVLTAAQWNASVRDNLNESAPAKATAGRQVFVATGVNAIAARLPQEQYIDTSESTTTTASFTNLATVGPTVISTTGSGALVSISSQIQNTTVQSYGGMGYDVSGATTVAAADDRALFFMSSTANALACASNLMLQSVTAGSNTFTARYRAGTAGTATFQRRRVMIFPL